MDAPGVGPRVQSFLVPKTGSSSAECEDALVYWSAPDQRDHYAAVADGASESMLAGHWAKRLVLDAIESMGVCEQWWRHVPLFAADLVARAGGNWDTFLANYREERVRRGRPIEWYEQPGLEKGAFATLLGVQLTPRESGRWGWHAFALGDTCLFHVAADGRVRSFPIEDHDAFGIDPQLLGSRNRDGALVAARLALGHGTALPGEQLLLATDALSAWLLSKDPAHGDVTPLGAVADLGPEDFADWVVDQRARGHMRNDDVALIRIRVPVGEHR